MKKSRYPYLLFLYCMTLQGIEKFDAIIPHKVVIEEYLTNELDDAIIAQQLATMLVENILTWKAPTIAAMHINSIVAYAFGNRICLTAIDYRDQ